jgi:hypothetical protein
VKCSAANTCTAWAAAIAVPIALVPADGSLHSAPLDEVHVVGGAVSQPRVALDAEQPSRADGRSGPRRLRGIVATSRRSDRGRRGCRGPRRRPAGGPRRSPPTRRALAGPHDTVSASTATHGLRDKASAFVGTTCPRGFISGSSSRDLPPARRSSDATYLPRSGSASQRQSQPSVPESRAPLSEPF